MYKSPRDSWGAPITKNHHTPHPAPSLPRSPPLHSTPPPTWVTDRLWSAWVCASGASISPARTTAHRVSPRSWSRSSPTAVDASLRNHPTLLPEAARSLRSANADAVAEQEEDEPDRAALLPLPLPVAVAAVVAVVAELGLAASVRRVVALKSRAKAEETPAGGAQFLAPSPSSLSLSLSLLPSGTRRASARIETIVSRSWRGKRICCKGGGRTESLRKPSCLALFVLRLSIAQIIPQKCTRTYLHQWIFYPSPPLPFPPPYF